MGDPIAIRENDTATVHLPTEREVALLELAEQAKLEQRYKMLAAELLHNEESWNQYMLRCQTIASVNMFGHKSADTVSIAGLKGFAMGWDLLSALERIKVIHNRPCIRGEAAVGHIRAKGYHFECTESTRESASWLCRRKGYPDKTFTYTLKEVKESKVDQKKDSLWVRFPTRLLKWACATIAAQEYFADVLGGFPIAEAVEGTYDEDGPESSDAPRPSGNTPGPSGSARRDAEPIDHQRQMAQLITRITKERLKKKGSSAVPGDEEFNKMKVAVWREATDGMPEPEGGILDDDGYAEVCKRLRGLPRG